MTFRNSSCGISTCRSGLLSAMLCCLGLLSATALAQPAPQEPAGPMMQKALAGKSLWATRRK